ncbi:MAG TPA: T9SS type A sorting domain-containing protein, partial [Chitinophagaceae bacterium]|nr:T9SS type A sorting domain-containing protein [Chitinophagaceae bacterium]
VNYPPASAPDTNIYTAGKWRIEVRPSIPSDTVIYLHTIQAGDSTTSALPGGNLLISDYSAGIDWADTLYFFPLNGELEVTTHFLGNIPGNRNTGIFAVDLKPGSYYIKVDGNNLNTAIADSSGILVSPVNLGAGNHTIEITRVVTGINNTVTPLPLKIFPNPANNILNIQLPGSPTSFKLYIYNTNGSLVLYRLNRLMPDISNLPEGLYFIRLISGDKLYTTSFLKH